MITIRVPLRFQPNTVIKFNPTEENLKNCIKEALIYEVEDDFFEKVVNESNINDADKEKIIKYLTSTDVDVLLKHCSIDYDSLEFDYFDAEDIIVYSIKLIFNENIAKDNMGD